jgi:1-acyl-sn-glycerol-3-phosphate acyltransferase
MRVLPTSAEQAAGGGLECVEGLDAFAGRDQRGMLADACRTPRSEGSHGRVADKLLSRRALRPLAWLTLHALLLFVGLLSLVWSVLALLLHPLLPRRTGRRLGRTMISRSYAFFWSLAQATGLLRLRADALDALRDEPGLIIVANHPSLLDALILVARLPMSACVMKASLRRNPFLGPGARLARYIRNDSARGMIRLAVQDLRQGGQLVLFPEGTRTTQAPINPLHASFALISQRANAPVQVVFIDTGSPYLSKGWPLWRLPPLPIVFSVRLGRRFEPTGERAQLLADVEAHLVAGVAAPRADTQQSGHAAHAPHAPHAPEAAP